MSGYLKDDKAPWYTSERKRDWLMMVPAALLFVAVSSVSTHEKALASTVSFLIFYVLITQMWDCRRERWFWMVIGAFALVHVVAIALIHFPSQLRPSFMYVFPATLADGLAMFAALRWLARRQLERANDPRS